MGFDGDLSCHPEILRLRGGLWLKQGDTELAEARGVVHLCGKCE